MYGPVAESTQPRDTSFVSIRPMHKLSFSQLHQVVHLVPQAFAAGDGVLGGAERYALELARHMARVVPTTLITFGNTEREDIIDELRVRVIGNPWYVRGQRYNPFSLRLFEHSAKRTLCTAISARS